VISLTRAIPECIRGGYDDVLYKSTFTLFYFTYCLVQVQWLDTIRYGRLTKAD